MSDKTFKNDIAVSSRVRFARNIAGYTFPHRANDEVLMNAARLSCDSLLKNDSLSAQKFRYVSCDNLSSTARTALAEHRLISSELGEHPYSGAVINEAENISVMLNEEDHVRIQCILPGFELEEAYSRANAIDDAMQESISFAFSEQYGFLTSCPTNLGTAMRAGVMVHVPALVLRGKLGAVIKAAELSGLTVRGAYGEGSNALGDLYQISNATSLGKSETELLGRIHEFTKEVIKSERSERNALLLNNEDDIRDQVCRAYGILTNAHMISGEEAMRLLSLVRMGLDIGIIDNLSPEAIDSLMTEIQPATLTMRYKMRTDARARDLLRARYIISQLTDNNDNDTERKG